MHVKRDFCSENSGWNFSTPPQTTNQLQFQNFQHGTPDSHLFHMAHNQEQVGQFPSTPENFYASYDVATQPSPEIFQPIIKDLASQIWQIHFQLEKLNSQMQSLPTLPN